MKSKVAKVSYNSFITPVIRLRFVNLNGNKILSIDLLASFLRVFERCSPHLAKSLGFQKTRDTVIRPRG